MINLGNVTGVVKSATVPMEANGTVEKRYVLWAKIINTTPEEYDLHYFDTALDSWKSFKSVREELVNSVDKRFDALVGITGDTDSIINKVNEMLASFQGFEEGTGGLLTKLNSKTDLTKHNADLALKTDLTKHNTDLTTKTDNTTFNDFMSSTNASLVSVKNYSDTQNTNLESLLKTYSDNKNKELAAQIKVDLNRAFILRGRLSNPDLRNYGVYKAEGDVLFTGTPLVPINECRLIIGSLIDWDLKYSVAISGNISVEVKHIFNTTYNATQSYECKIYDGDVIVHNDNGTIKYYGKSYFTGDLLSHNLYINTYFPLPNFRNSISHFKAKLWADYSSQLIDMTFSGAANLLNAHIRSASTFNYEDYKAPAIRRIVLINNLTQAQLSSGYVNGIYLFRELGRNNAGNYRKFISNVNLTNNQNNGNYPISTNLNINAFDSILPSVITWSKYCNANENYFYPLLSTT